MEATGAVYVDNLTFLTPLTNAVAGSHQLTGADNRTTMNLNGTLQMVAGRLSTALTGGFDPAPSGQSSHAALQIEFVPEPGSLALIGAGAFALVGLSVVRRRG